MDQRYKLQKQTLNAPLPFYGGGIIMFHMQANLVQ